MHLGKKDTGVGFIAKKITVIPRVLLNSNIGVLNSNFLILTPTFWKA